MPNYYAKFLGGAPFIDDYVSTGVAVARHQPARPRDPRRSGPPVRFHPTPRLEFFPAGTQMLAGSEFIEKMRSGGTPAVPGITYTNIVTKFDELVIPYKSGIEPGMTNIVVQNVLPARPRRSPRHRRGPDRCPAVLNALDPGERGASALPTVLPVLGSLR